MHASTEKVASKMSCVLRCLLQLSLSWRPRRRDSRVAGLGVGVDDDDDAGVAMPT